MSDHRYGIPPPAFRLPDRTHVGGVRLQVASVDRSAAYYGALLGLEPRVEPSGLVALAPRGTEHPLIELAGQPGARPVPKGGVLGLYHFAILLPDRARLGRFVRHLGSSGVRFASADHFVSEALYLWDPDGLGIEVYADRPREIWQTRDRELVMTTEPLDLESLVRAGGAEPWDGMPPGTTLGHVHLSVGDLKGAAAFYHAALGLDRTVWSYPGALFLAAGGYHHHLGVNTWSAGAQVARETDARLLEWSLRLPTSTAVGHAASSLEGAGYSVIADADDRIAVDPWNVRLRLRAD